MSSYPVTPSLVNKKTAIAATAIAVMRSFKFYCFCSLGDGHRSNADGSSFERSKTSLSPG